MTASFDGLPPLRDVIKMFELRAMRALGQNFLLDMNLTSKIARQAGDIANSDILEIGPGPGGLTRALLAEGARKVVVVERDARCLPALNAIAAHYPQRLHVIMGDALKVDPLEFLHPPVLIVANLPYNIGTELLIQWLRPDAWPPFWTKMTLMFQREVAERIVAVPGSKSYGRLSLLVQWLCDVRIAFDIPPTAFTPAPKVTSSVVQFSRLAKPRYPADPVLLEKTIRHAFGQRRKMLRSSLRGLHSDIEDKLRQVGIAPTDRAEQIDLQRFCMLANTLT